MQIDAAALVAQNFKKSRHATGARVRQHDHFGGHKRRAGADGVVNRVLSELGLVGTVKLHRLFTKRGNFAIARMLDIVEVGVDVRWSFDRAR